MKNFYGSLISLIILFSANAAAENSAWSAKSTETTAGQHSEPVLTSSNGKTSTGASTQNKQGASSGQTLNARSFTRLGLQQSINENFWIYDAWVTLSTDLDYDGYYHRFTLEFDADTVFAQANVYARLYLGLGEEFKEYHATSDFIINGDISEDSFVLDTELITGFAPRDYELLIELYDARSNELVAVLDGYEDADLYLLSLESYDYDEVYEETHVVVVHEGGSVHISALLLLALLVLGRTLGSRKAVLVKVKPKGLLNKVTS